ncbi:PREDICTED: inner centromere protein isoform X1 [Papilio xuthus]|uniref:Inner centromere protein isoform X1 n=1 Tax=Papilio xuthus TaxID=66420 RepID=A0AAJ7EKV4_PAPXU|nr:PREDICTED: inner centromere protein isoform X1 [Papilio xuthus]
MLIGLVRDSVMQCFCHSCRAPVLPAGWEQRTAQRRSAPVKKPIGKPRTKQPKKVKFITTEIRCQEMSKGGLAYEVILAEPVGVPAPRRADSPEKTPSVEEIQEKLKAAEERRRSLEASKMAVIAQKMAKIEEASRIRSEQTNNFICTTKEALDAKMDSHEEKREAYISELRARLKDHLEGVEKTRLSLEQQTAEVYKAIEEKMNTAADKRDENIKKMLERLREHEEQVQKVRDGNRERFQQLESAIQEKLQQAAERRLQLEAEQKEKLRNHNNKLAEVRSVISAKMEEITKDIEVKLTTAEQNREKEIQKKLDFVKKEERRAELVRQNKNARAETEPAPTSG